MANFNSYVKLVEVVHWSCSISDPTIPSSLSRRSPRDRPAQLRRRPTGEARPRKGPWEWCAPTGRPG